MSKKIKKVTEMTGADLKQRLVELAESDASPCSECTFKSIARECSCCFALISTERLELTTPEPEPECVKGCSLRDPCSWCHIGNGCMVDACDTWCPGCRKPKVSPCRCGEPKLEKWGESWLDGTVYCCETCGGCRCIGYKEPQSQARIVDAEPIEQKSVTP